MKTAGYDVAIAGRDETKLKEAGLPWFAVDVTDEASIAALAAKAGPVDIFIANAGAAPTAATLKTSRAMWDQALAVNLTSVFSSAQAFAPPMIERGWGRFIAIASTASFRAYPYTGAYAAAKHGVLGWIKSLALEHAKSGVTFNAVCPGFTDTPLLAGCRSSGGEIRRRYRRRQTRARKRQSDGRLVAPEEVAAAVLYLASDAAASVNGQSIIIDGGELIA